MTNGNIYEAFGTATPADITAAEIFTHPATVPFRAPISGGESGWIERPDTGKTDLSKEVPIDDDPWIMLLFALIYMVTRFVRERKRLHAILILMLFSGSIGAAISALEFSPGTHVRGGNEIVINPTVVSVPEGSVMMCWELYRDAACTSEENITFLRALSEGKNAVRCTMPNIAGTYYIKSSIQTGTSCGTLLDSYYVTPVYVYPTDADVVLTREAQESAERVDLTNADAKKAYGALRFRKDRLNDDTKSLYERYNYFISFPFDVQVADIHGIGSVGTHWLIYYYDGKGRAEEGFFAERTDNWVMIDDTDSVLHAGQGYLLQLNYLRMAEDQTDVWTDGQDVATLFFPALSTFSEIVNDNETIPALSEAYQCTINLSASLGAEGDRRIKDSYWRCIGVPSFDAPSGVSELNYLYKWNSVDNSLSVISSEGYNFLPTHAYLVQNEGPIIWSDVTKRVAIPARQTNIGAYEWRLDLFQDTTMCDHTYIRMSEEASSAFDFNKDLIKELNFGKDNLYTLVGYERLAGNSLPISDHTIHVSVGLQVVSTDDYTFSMPKGTHGVNVVLVDSITRTRTNLAWSDYSVSLNAGTYDHRFVLEFQVGTDTPTGHEENIGSRPHSGTRKELINRTLYIIRDGKMYDARGVLVQ